MNFTFEVGEAEKHQVTFHWDKWWGRLRIGVDDNDVIRQTAPLSFSWSLTRRHEFAVGQSEVHAVVIELTRKRWFGGMREQDCRAFVDGVLVGEY